MSSFSLVINVIIMPIYLESFSAIDNGAPLLCPLQLELQYFELQYFSVQI